MDKAQKLAEAMLESRAFETGVLADLSEAELFIYGVGRDTISDLTTNVLRGVLTDYTKDQCGLHDIPIHLVRTLGPVWNPNSLDWEAVELELPISNDRPVLLVPKFSVRRRLSIDSQEFYNKYMIEFLQAEYLNSASALVQVLKNGTRRVTKKSVKERHPFIKDALAIFVRDHPEILEIYKNFVGAKGPLTTKDIDEEFDEPAFSRALIDRLADIPGGTLDADKYHRLSIGICTFLFHPDLITPIKEFGQHEGRKRVDIKFSNAAENGFFHRMNVANQTRALAVMFECKNYTHPIGNEALDQLSGRFGHQRGFLALQRNGKPYANYCRMS